MKKKLKRFELVLTREKWEREMTRDEFFTRGFVECEDAKFAIAVCKDWVSTQPGWQALGVKFAGTKDEWVWDGN